MKMRQSKLILYNILTFIAAINVTFLYFSNGLIEFSLTKDYFLKIITPTIIISILFFLNLLVTSSYISAKVITRKNSLKITLLILSILFISSIIKRISETLNGYYCISCWLSTILYLLLIITTILILKDLYRLVKNLFHDN